MAYRNTNNFKLPLRLYYLLLINDIDSEIVRYIIKKTKLSHVLLDHVIDIYVFMYICTDKLFDIAYIPKCINTDQVIGTECNNLS